MDPPRDRTPNALEKHLSLTTGHHALLRRRLADGLESARERLAGTPAAATRLALHDVSSCALSELDAERVPGAIAGDVIAGVVQRFEGRLSGTVLFALDPGDALLWLQSTASAEATGSAQPGDDDPLARFVGFGSRIIAGLVESLAAVGRDEIWLGPPALEERPWMAALLGTHAPSDTVVLSLTGELGFEIDGVYPALSAPFAVQILLEPKLVAGIVHGLATGHSDEDSDRPAR